MDVLFHLFFFSKPTISEENIFYTIQKWRIVPNFKSSGSQMIFADHFLFESFFRK